MSEPLFVIEITHGDGTSEIHEIVDDCKVLGRSKSNADILVDDKKVSGQHIELSYVDGSVQAQDLGSTNGTFFCDEQIHDVVTLKPGESLHIGDASVRLMAVFGTDMVDEAKTMVSMPAWMNEETDLGAEATRALSVDEMAVVLSTDEAALVNDDTEGSSGTLDLQDSSVEPATRQQPQRDEDYRNTKELRIGSGGAGARQRTAAGLAGVIATGLRIFLRQVVHYAAVILRVVVKATAWVWRKVWSLVSRKSN